MRETSFECSILWETAMNAETAIHGHAKPRSAPVAASDLPAKKKSGINITIKAADPVISSVLAVPVPERSNTNVTMMSWALNVGANP
jgi:hypothetical protein